MGYMQKRVTFRITGMYCNSCSERIKQNVRKLGTEELEISYERGTLTCLTYEPNEIIEVISKMGYGAEIIDELPPRKQEYKGVIVAILFLLGAYLIIKNTIGFNLIPNLDEQVSYSILFLLGIVTSLHCLSMCGGIVLSQSIAFKNPVKATILYNGGRVVAYTLLGGMIGGFGSIISFSPQMKGYITIFAGGFMILLGLSMLEPFGFLKKYLKLPRIFSTSKLKQSSRTPLLIGLATGLMPCGPLQTMQLYALGTGSVFKGALSMLIFSLGTVPLMMGFGTISGYISSGLNKKLLKVSAMLVMALGLIIINRGLILQGSASLSGLIIPSQGLGDPMLPEIINGYQVITTSANNNGYEPNFFILERGRTVKWIIKGDSINGCNNEIVIPKLGIKERIMEGHNVIEFTPEEEGELNFSCWMGMLDGQFMIVEDLNNIPDNITPLAAPTTPCCTR